MDCSKEYVTVQPMSKNEAAQIYAEKRYELELFNFSLKVWKIIVGVLTTISVVWSTWMLIKKMPIDVNGPFLFTVRLILLFYTYPFLFYASAVCAYIGVFKKTNKNNAS